MEIERRENAEASDTQRAKSSIAGGLERGFAGGKHVYGRKRHLRTDTRGLLISAWVHAARLYNGEGATQVLVATKTRGITRKKVWIEHNNERKKVAVGAWMADARDWQAFKTFIPAILVPLLQRS